MTTVVQAGLWHYSVIHFLQIFCGKFLAAFFNLANFSRATVHVNFLELKVIKLVLFSHHLSDTVVQCTAIGS